MKKIMILLLMLSTIFSCTENNHISENNDIAQPHQISELVIGMNTVRFNTWFGESVAQENTNYNLLISKNRFPNYILQQFINDLSLSIKKDNLLGLIIYTNSHYVDKSNLESSTIVGVLCYYTNSKNNLMVDYFNYKGNFIKGLHSKVKNIAFDDIYTVGNIHSNNKPISAIVIFNEDLSYDKSWLSKSYKKVIDNFIKESKFNQRTSFYKSKCKTPYPFPCNGVFKGNRCIPQEKPGGIVRYICACICAGKRLIQLNENSGRNSFFSEDDLYSFRDDFLASSSKGIQYIEDYYRLSDYFLDDISVQDAIEIVRIGNEIVPKLKHFSSSQENDIILYNNSLKVDIINLINSFSKKTNDEEILVILNQIKNDVIMFSGKSIEDIKSQMN